MESHNPSAIKRIFVDDKEILLLGTAHISQTSVEEVRRLIPAEKPDAVCIELDRQRFNALRENTHWQSLNITQVIKKGQLPYLMVSLALSSFQKRMGLQTGVKPGAELAAAAEIAEQEGIPLELIDRDIRTTLLRAWRKTGFWKKMTLLASFLAGFFEKQQIDEETLNQLKETDTLSAMLNEMGEALPSVKTILVDERDRYMVSQLRRAQGKKLLAIVGAAHVPGIIRLFQEGYKGEDMDEISRIPPKSTFSRILPWLLPAVVALLFILGFAAGDWEKASEAALAWILANGLLASLGTALALGHPLTIASAFFAAPITSLNPMIAAGFVTALVQALVAAPTVRDMEAMGEDMTSVRGWWKNRMTRVMLVFFFSNLGSAAGTLVSFYWLKELL